jgi:cell division protein FtsQ
MKTDDRRRFRRRRFTQRLVALRPVLIGVAAAALVCGVVWLFLFSSVLAAENVEVTGTDVLTPARIRAVADVPLGEPLARIDPDVIQARVEDLVAVASVDVSRCWPETVCIDITEREAVAVVDREGRLWGLDAHGILFREYDKRPVELPLVKMKATTGADALAEAAQIVAALPASLARRVDHLDVQTVDEISLRLRDGALVIWGSADDSANKVRVLAPLLEARPQATEYNVSVAGSPTVKVP